MKTLQNVINKVADNYHNKLIPVNKDFIDKTYKFLKNSLIKNLNCQLDIFHSDFIKSNHDKFS